MIHDISPAVDADLKVWPGDTPPSREILLDMRQGDNLTLSTLHTTVHAGAHADAPSHYGTHAQAIHDRPLDVYIGECQVVHVDVPRGVRISREHLKSEIHAPRALFATGTYPDPTQFNEDFAAFEPELIDDLASAGLKLIGIDTPSVDLYTSKELPAHNACLRNDLAILEGLVLRSVPEGVYELIALPLKLVNFDASPVRAILRDLDLKPRQRRQPQR